MRRSIGIRDYLHIRTYTLTVGTRQTVEMVGCNMFKVKCTTVGAGATLLYRGVKEDANGQSDATDTGALNTAFCDILSATMPDSGWVDSQSSALRVEAVVGTVTMKVMWTSRILPTIE